MRFIVLLCLLSACAEEDLLVHVEEPPLPEQHCLDGARADLCIELSASHLGALRGIAFAPNGDLYGVVDGGPIKRFRDLDGDGAFDEVSDYASAFLRGSSISIDASGTWLYAGTQSGVARWRIDPLIDHQDAFELVVYGAPTDGPKGFVTVLVDGDALYAHVGPRANAVAPALPEFDRARAVIKRFDLGTYDPGHPYTWDEAGEVVAVGLSRTPAMAKDSAGNLYALELAMRGVEYAADTLLAIEPGSAQGYPYCFFTSERDVPLAAEVGFENPHDDAWCAANIAPAHATLEVRSEPSALIFPRDGGEPFVALHASRNVLVRGDEVLWASDRVTPFGLAISPIDGALYVSSDDGMIKKEKPTPADGALYRVALRR